MLDFWRWIFRCQDWRHCVLPLIPAFLCVICPHCDHAIWIQWAEICLASSRVLYMSYRGLLFNRYTVISDFRRENYLLLDKFPHSNTFFLVSLTKWDTFLLFFLLFSKFQAEMKNINTFGSIKETTKAIFTLTLISWQWKSAKQTSNIDKMEWWLFSTVKRLELLFCSNWWFWFHFALLKCKM